VDRHVGPVAPRPETAPPPVRSESPRVQQEPPRAPQADGDLKALVMTELAKVLKIDRSSIDENESFQDYGLDSITGTQLATRMEKVVGIEISPAWLIEFSTIEALAKKILLEKQNQGQG
jgi:acyl carrier protein